MSQCLIDKCNAERVIYVSILMSTLYSTTPYFNEKNLSLNRHSPATVIFIVQLILSDLISTGYRPGGSLINSDWSLVGRFTSARPLTPDVTARIS